MDNQAARRFLKDHGLQKDILKIPDLFREARSDVGTETFGIEITRVDNKSQGWNIEISAYGKILHRFNEVNTYDAVIIIEKVLNAQIMQFSFGD